VGEKNTCKY
jgi:hypothetical protein